MNDPLDEIAHILSEIMNDNAPIGWERYRGFAGFVLHNERLLQLMRKAQEAGETDE